MNKDRVLRRALWFSAPYNVGGAALFAFPSSLFGQFAGLPTSVPPLYSTLLGFFVLLFGGAYAWLAMQGEIDRPLVAFAAIGKAGVFTLILVLWIVGSAPPRGVLAASGDLVLAVIFAWYLL